MAGTRSSARLAASGSSQSSDKASTGDKRKAATGSSPSTKRGKKKQTKIEDAMANGDNNGDGDDKHMEDAPAPEETEPKDSKPEDQEAEASVESSKDGQEAEAQSNDKAKLKDEKPDEKEEDVQAAQQDSSSAVEASKRDDQVPSSILEKGIIYFFFRGRVNVEDPDSVDDIARSYIVMRPLPHGAKLGDGPIGDDGNARLVALPKKVLPRSHRDRFISFVEKTKTTFKDLRENFVAGADYETKTVGTRHTPAATPIGEGVYAITSTGRESHLAYILTTPSEISEVQKDMGLRERGSYVISTRNPQYDAPNNVSPTKGPEFPQEIIDEFRSLRWLGVQPKHLDYVNTQVLFIGEGLGELGKAVQQQDEDAKDKKETPAEEMEKLEHEDEVRADNLKGDDPVFEDLGLSAKDYPKMQTTW